MQSSSFPLLSSRRQVLRAGLLAAFGSVAALELLGSGQASASSGLTGRAHRRCAPLQPSFGDRRFVDDRYRAVSERGILHCRLGALAIDAYNSRGIRTKLKKDHYTGLTSVDAIRATSGDSDLWVVALGSNDAGIYAKAKQAEVIGMMMDKIGSGHTVMWVNVYLPKAPQRQNNWNWALATVAKERGDEMFVFDWASLAEKNPHWLADDQVHYTNKGYLHRAVGHRPGNGRLRAHWRETLRDRAIRRRAWRADRYLAQLPAVTSRQPTSE